MKPEPNIGQLRDFFLSHDCNGVVALIDYLASSEAAGVMKIGSNTLNLDGKLAAAKTEQEVFDAVFFGTYRFGLGSNDGSTTPLQSIAQIATDFETFPEEGRKLFDRICKDLADISTAPIVGMVESYSREGHRTISAEQFQAERAELRRRNIN